MCDQPYRHTTAIRPVAGAFEHPWLVGDSWFLFHLGNDKTRKRWSAGVAISKDGKEWKKSSANPVLDIGAKDAWDGGSLMSLDVLWRDGRFHVWYAAHAAGLNDKNENEMGIRIGYATSMP